MDRRNFLKTASLTALGAFAAPSFARAAARTASPLSKAAVDRFPQIQHVVVLVMENHSFDNILGSLKRPGVDGLTFKHGRALNTNPDANGNPVAAFHLSNVCQDGYHITQSWGPSHRQWNGGKMDGFVVTSGVEAMGYYTEDDLPVTHALAKVFPVCDRWFASTMCQTFPNRMVMFAGTSQGSITTDVPERAGASPPAGGTIFDRLNAAGISWKNYFVEIGDSMLWGPAQAAAYAPHVTSVAEFFVDAATGQLPSLSVITPEAEEASEENPQNVSLGEAYVWAIANAVLTSPAWSSTMLLITYDEHGGYYDHVPPVAVPNPDGIHPATSNYLPDDFTYTGFRVPTIVVSPWARRHHVSHTVYDHTSLLAFLERKWGLAPLTRRDAAAANMLDLFDFSRPAFATPPSIPQPNAEQKTLDCIKQGKRPVAIPGA
ncbi:MAG: alkaline phosphatase family protein [Actinomycetota bacterium]